ncbi:CapA family protein [Mobilicoccus caccae]|uniref:CapA family protein n=1 Tax=Mobilicoccus caccae TaxID=1859295 RepID=UPI0024E0AE9E|nr:CapA family protein [Mobilicoccus caccae]
MPHALRPRVRVPLCGVPLLAALTVAGCASAPPPASDDSAPEASPGPAQSSASASASPSTSSPPSPANPRQITLAFAGDVHFERQLAPLLRDGKDEWATRLPELAAADFAMVNLETALTERGSPAAKTYTFRAPPAALDVLSSAGVDAVSMANNHAADYGRTGIEDTLAAIAKSPIPVAGFGKDESAAYAPVSVDVQGVRVGIVAATEIAEETYANHSAGPDKPGVAQNVERDRFTRAATEAVRDHDLVVAYMHWGTEGSTCPNERQVETARVLGDAGVDVIVGTHAHRPQGSGWTGRTFVGYGTGNFVWYNASPGSRSSGVLSVSVDADSVRARKNGQDPRTSVVKAYEWAPKIISGGGVPQDPTASRAAVTQAADAAKRCSGLAQEPGSG